MSKHFLIISFLTLFASSLFCVVLVLSSILISWRPKKESISDSAVYEYKYLQVSSETNNAFFGHTTSSRMIDEGEFIHYHTGNEHFLVSHFGTDEYSCTGSCFCEDENFRRDAVSVLPRSIFFLVAAVSVVMVVDKANEYFRRECEESFYGTNCLSVNSVVEACEPVVNSAVNDNNNDNNKEDIINNMYDELERKGERRRYLCHGNCLTKKRFRDREPFQESLNYGCENLKFEGSIHLDTTGIFEHRLIRFAMAKFMEELLKPFCKQRSRWKYYHTFPRKMKVSSDYNNNGILGTRFGKRGYWSEVSLCTGSSGVKAFGVVNPSIKCQRVYELDVLP